MAMALCTLSHSPLLGVNQPERAVVDAVDAAFAAARAELAHFAPDLVLLLAPDHYNGFFYDMMPPFCLGTGAESVGDWGSAAGPLRVDADAAATIARSVLRHGIDLATSARMQVDHGFAQPLEVLFGAVDAVPVVPVFVNCAAPPLGPVRRVRLLGEALGRAVLALGRRTVVIGSGGLSHDPPIPQLEGASPEVADRLIAGRHPTAEARAARERAVLDTGRAFAAGTATIAPLDPEWDERVMALLAAGDLDELDSWGPDEFAAAGRGAPEVRTWIAAYAALGAAGPYRVRTTFYHPVPEWIAGFGVTTARTTRSDRSTA